KRLQSKAYIFDPHAEVYKTTSDRLWFFIRIMPEYRRICSATAMHGGEQLARRLGQSSAQVCPLSARGYGADWQLEIRQRVALF
ncbi:hypothetical protein N9Q44_04250, partial [Gammaproteobacteria bacterium]|nr:hypothetical protein [Gammaproteobacteria bacterium]